MLDFQTQIADAGQFECVTALASTHAQFIEDITTAYIKAARDTLRQSITDAAPRRCDQNDTISQRRSFTNDRQQFHAGVPPVRRGDH
jgi:hypothetical protein